MTSLTRRLAESLLSAVAHRHANNDWGVAMLRELDAIESDWSALRWALGGTIAIVRRDVSLHATGVLIGVAVAALVLTACMGGLAHLAMFHTTVAQWLTAIVLPEIVCVVAALALWHRRRATAMGFALTAILFVAHVCLYVTASA